MGLFLDLLQTYKRWTQNKVARNSYQTVEYDPTFCSVTEDPANQRLVVSGPVTTQPGTFTNLTAASFVLTGSFTQGPMTMVTGLGTTTGPGSGIILTLPMPDNSVATIDADFVGRDPSTLNYAVISLDSLVVQVQGGAIVNSDGMPTFPGNTLGLPVAISAVTWAAGVLTITGRGPMATITSAGANGGHVTLFMGSTVTSGINGANVTISGLTVCTEANGTHAATFVDGTTIDLAAVPSVHTGADSGTMVLATAPVIAWKTWGEIVVAT